MLKIEDVIALKTAELQRVTREVECLLLVIPMLVEDSDVLSPMLSKVLRDPAPTAEETVTAKPPDKRFL